MTSAVGVRRTKLVGKVHLGGGLCAGSGREKCGPGLGRSRGL